ncbi:hypothetical protein YASMINEVIRUS_1417 [Yasminevirus sp. GU-2018]|uniref:2OG-Fe(II) oxygenase n=1 Tax=Yasminevirus sp. GU-2018 TaxID=2420051 RepID=A0A5K0UAZ3_9VIRU|nr:hypothetical protein YASMINEVIRUS_1417 [Yasminevirus sp. GU-2018]
METYTLTFGNRAENHKGMQIIGKKMDHGLSHDDLLKIQKFFDDAGCVTELINLNSLLYDDDAEKEESDDSENVRTEDTEDSTEENTEDSGDAEDSKTEDNEDPAELLVIKNGINELINSDDLFEEQKNLEKDTQAFMYGRVVNKKARYNLCFSDFSQDADYANKKGTVYNFKDVKLLRRLRDKLGQIHPSLKKLQCEGNYYYDVSKTFIGFHGDSEREIVVGCRLGADFPLYFQWYYKGETEGRLYKIVLSHGDIYFMSDKAVGRDWKSSSIYTLRHAAGLEKNVGL